MKCKDCIACRKGYFPSRPNDYICIGVKNPFVITDIKSDCTEYPERNNTENKTKSNLKLYSFCPQGHGQLSFYIIAESEESAITRIKEYIKNNNLDEYDYYGFGTDYYQVTVTEPNAVITNHND